MLIVSALKPPFSAVAPNTRPPVPLLLMVCGFVLFVGLAQRHPVAPFVASLGLFVLSYMGLLISFYPYMVPSSVTLWDAAGPDSSLKFLLVGAVVLLPVVLAYTIYAYWVFRGKVGESGGYHS